METVLVKGKKMQKTDALLNGNPLDSRISVQKSLLDLLEPVKGFYTEGGLDLGNTGAHYAPRVAQMEGWSRLLWGLAPLACGGGSYPAYAEHLAILRRGIDPASDGYWGLPGDSDQRLVEMAAIALSLMIAPDQFWVPLSSLEKQQLHTWLGTIQECTLPANNWHFFRILVCASFRILGLQVNEKAEEESFALVESCYRGDGWYMDGSSGNYDLYNPFGFHFYSLLYAKLMGDRYPERAARYIERATLFAPQFIPWFRPDGSMVPYGRSLTYRFAAVSFFSACAFTGIEVLPWGELKGLILRNLRWWFSQPILDNAGILSVGYTYPNLVMAEQYNSPGSPYWSLKTYLILALDTDHPFWAAKEKSLPPMKETTLLKVPGYIISRTEEDTVLLCPGRYPGWEAVHSASKYCKFAYSARFGFSVSHSAYSLEKTGCDSSLVLSEGDGYWRERRHTTEQKSGDNWISSRWKPWADVDITTVIIALGAVNGCQGWHLRIHLIESRRVLEIVEGGFSIPRYRGNELPPVEENSIRTSPAEAACCFPWAASRIVDLLAGRRGEILRMEPNLNIQESSGNVPVLRGEIPKGTTLIACAVRAGNRSTTMDAAYPSLEISINGNSLEVQEKRGVSISKIPIHRTDIFSP